MSDLIVKIENPPSSYNRIKDLKTPGLFYDKDFPPSGHDGMDVLIVTEVLSATHNSTVYGARFQTDEGAVGIDVALKFGDFGALCKEADRYSDMEKLQGINIPRMIGLYFGDTKDGDVLGVLVTEKFGAALSYPFNYLSFEQKFVSFVLAGRRHLLTPSLEAPS